MEDGFDVVDVLCDLEDEWFRLPCAYLGLRRAPPFHDLRGDFESYFSHAIWSAYLVEIGRAHV